MIAAAGVVARLVRIDARSPLRWCVTAAAALAAALVVGGRPVPAVGCGLLLGVAALGGLLREAAIADLMACRIAARLVWPLVGTAVGVAVVCLRGAAVADMGGAVAVMAGCVAAAGGVWAARLCRLPGATRFVFDTTGAQPVVGQAWIDAVAMASTIVAMAVCFFLAPELAGWYAGLTTAWFTLLAVPVATLAGGDTAARRALVAACPGGPRLPGTASRALAALAAYAAILAWPAAVAWLVSRGRPGPASGALAAIAALGVMLAVSLAAVAAASRWRWREDGPLAVVASIHALAVAAWAGAV